MTYTNDDLPIMRPLETALQVVHRLQPRAFEFADPSVVDFLERDRVEKVELLAAAPLRHDESCAFEHTQVLRHRLTRHVVVIAQLRQRLPVMSVEQVQQLSTARIRQRLEDCIRIPAHSSDNMQVITCMSTMMRSVRL